ncbi:hypothetical protein [Actinomadura macra]|uniref:hypothetical protein n=1 Tax=Actinomadura macra TaxID=46164 RepID=UPI0012FB7276|nr:hypothetical protein [Actinomadura macra]
MSFDRPRRHHPVVDQPTSLSPSESALARLAVHLDAHRLKVELTREGLRVWNPDVAGCCDDNPEPSDLITCRPFERDGGLLWFFTSANDPIIEADQMHDAALRIKGFLAGERVGLFRGTER